MRKVLICGEAALAARSWADSLRAAGVETSILDEASLAPVLTAETTMVIVALDAPGPGVAEALRLVMRAAAAGEPDGDVPPGSSGPLADYGPGLAHAEWRNALFNLTSGVEATYIGWTNGAGKATVGVLRGAVVSPLATSPDAEFSWGDCDAGAVCLAEAILADSMRSAAAFDGPTGDVVERFVKEIVDRLPSDGFELSSADVRSWLRQNLD
jgi:hypothetical protein